jgi:hypothetical protein
MKAPEIIYGCAALIAVLVLWIAAPIAIVLEYGQPGTAADMATVLGVASALFTGLAFAGLLYTLALQRRQLALQQAEVRLTREELHLLAESQGAAARSLASQLHEMETARQLSAAMELFDELNSDASMATRRRIYSLRSQDDPAADPDLLREVEQLLNRLNLVGYLMAKGFLPEHPTLELFYITVSRIWAQLSDHIISTRIARGVYLFHFQWLVQQSLDYWREHHESYTIAIHNPATGRSSRVDREAMQQKLKDLSSGGIEYFPPTPPAR